MNNNETNNEGRIPGTDVSNFGDYTTMTARTPDGKEIELRLYGR